MPQIEITRPNGEVHTLLFDEQDRDLVEGRKWTIKPQRNTYYAVAKVEGRVLRLHRMMLPNYVMVDHINRNGLDNRRANLRATTPHENGLNTGRPRASGPRLPVGIQRRGRKWWVGVPWQGKTRYLGMFEDIEKAIEVRDSYLELSNQTRPQD